MGTIASHCSELATLLKGYQSFVVSAHVSPDADAIGSSVALALGLRSLGKEADVVLYDTVPDKFLSLSGDLIPKSSLPKSDFDCLIVVDTATEARVGRFIADLRARASNTINIDHHISNSAWGDVNYIDSAAASSSIIVFELLESLQVEISSAIANLLYAGLMDDTGQFRYSNTDRRALETAAKLVQRGAKPEEVSNALYFTVPASVFKLQAAALATLETVCDGQVGFIHVTQEVLNVTGASASDTENLIDIARAIAGTRAAIFVRELERGAWKCSLRAKDPILSVNDIAEKFGGGGHRAASGCVIDGDFSEVKAALVAAFSDALQKL